MERAQRLPGFATQGRLGLLLVAVCWPLNWTLPGQRTAYLVLSALAWLYPGRGCAGLPAHWFVTMDALVARVHPAVCFVGARVVAL